MKFDITRDGIDIFAEQPIDLAFIEEVLKLRENGDAVFLVRENTTRSFLDVELTKRLRRLTTAPNGIPATVGAMLTKIAFLERQVEELSFELGQARADQCHDKNAHAHAALKRAAAMTPHDDLPEPHDDDRPLPGHDPNDILF